MYTKLHFKWLSKYFDCQNFYLTAGLTAKHIVLLIFMLGWCFLGFGQQAQALVKAHKSERQAIYTEQLDKKAIRKKASEPSHTINHNATTKNGNRPINQQAVYGPVQDTGKNPMVALKAKQEDLSKRDVSSKHFINRDGSYTALVGAGPIHYKNNGKWEDIDHTITHNNDTLFPYSNITNLLESYFGATSDLGVINKTKEGIVKEFLNTKMYWEVNGQAVGARNSSNSVLIVEGDKAYYNNLYGSIGAEFTILSGKRKLNYIIPNSEALGDIPLDAKYLVFNEDVILPNGWYHKIDDRNAIVIYNKIGNKAFRYETPISMDSGDGNTIELKQNTVYETSLNDNILTIKTKVSTSWLLNPTTIFPVKIDPTVNVWGNTNGAVNWNGLWVNLNGWDVVSGINANQLVNGYSTYDVSSIPLGSNINSAISSISVRGNNTFDLNGHLWSSCNFNVDLATSGQLWFDENEGLTSTIYWVGVPYNVTPGNYTQNLNLAAINDIEASLAQGWFTMRLQIAGDYWDLNFNERIGIYGDSGNTTPGSTHRPYLIIDYSDPCNPISASASQPVICEGESTTLTVTGTSGYTYQWFDDFDADTLTGNLIGSGNSINVSPTISSQYAVLSNCGTYDFVGVAVVPPPSVMVTSPVEVQMCDSNDIIREITVSGGTVPEIVLSETFNPDSSIPWITSANVAAGGNVLNALWYIYASGPGFSSNDNSDFVLVDSDLVGAYNMESNLTSPPFSLADYVAPINLNFFHHYLDFIFDTTDTARVQVSLDLGETWADIQTYTTTQGTPTNFAEVNLNLNAYAGEPVVMIRFNYTANNDWYWAIDNVTVTGTPRPTTLSWAPFTYLYLDNTATTPYNGENVSTVYTLPDNNITYTVTAESYYGCSVDVEIDVIGGVAVWDGSNWLNGSLPDIGKNVILNGNYTTNAITGSFSACNLVVNNNLRVDNNYFVEVENNVTVTGSVLVETQGAFVQNNDGGSFVLSGGGTATVNKSTALKQNWYDYTYWSSPVVNETVSGAFPDTPSNRRFWFNAQNYIDTDNNDIDDDGNDWTIAPGSSNLIPGLGYAATSVNIGPAFPRIDLHTFNGSFNTGDINVNVYTNTLNTLNNWNFIGNPYPSGISFYDLYDENISVISGAAYLWSQASPPEAGNPGNEQLNFNQNDYAIITAYSGGTAGASLEEPTEFIPSGQGFFVNALSTGVVTFKNNMRRADATSNSQFFRNSVIENNRIWINLSSDNGLFSQILMAYIDGASDYFDGYAYDAPRNASVSNAGTLFTSIENQDNRKFAIQGKNPSSLSENEIINLGFNTSINQPTLYTIDIERFEGMFFDSHPIYLKDNYLGNIHNLKESGYLFTSQPGEFLNRFEIVFQDQTLTITDQQLNSVSIFKVQNELNVKSPNQPIKSVSVHDMLGRTIGNYQNIDNNNFNFQLDQSNGTYIISAELDNGVIITKKVIH